VNEVLVSVDAFHQEHVPLEPVMMFVDSLVRHGVPALRMHPAWLVNEQHENEYNNETKRLLKLFNDKGIVSSEGNNIFPSGSALKHLGEYFSPPEEIDLSLPCGSFPYTGRLDEIECFTINPNGDVRLCSMSIGNIYNDDVLDIVDNYEPYNNPVSSAVLNEGVAGLLRYAETQGAMVNISDCRSVCGVCRKVMTLFER
jgi:hypothetical protein